MNAPAEGVTTIPGERRRWSVWARGLSGEALVRFGRDEVFGFCAEMITTAANNFIHGARLTIDEPTQSNFWGLVWGSICGWACRGSLSLFARVRLPR